jgi:hypothetical protein
MHPFIRYSLHLTQSFYLSRLGMNIRLQFVYIKLNNRSILPGIKALEKQNKMPDNE